MRFEWDPHKAAANVRTHGISFAEAVTVFSDVGSLLVVVYSYRSPDTIRMISAWKANKRQKGLYEKDRS